MLYIRADGNAEIGTGHVMRCLSIAKARRKEGRDSVFIVADQNMKPLLDEQGFSVVCLASVWNDLDQETVKMERLIGELPIEKLLIDSYFVTPDYLARLHRLTHLIYMDDLDAFLYPCGTLINYNIYAEKHNYPARYPDTKLLLGPRYAPLREEFLNLPPRQARDPATTVLVTVGGSDSFNIAGQFVERAKNNPDLSQLHYHIVAGRLNSHMPQLEALAERYPGISVHQNVSTMSELMLASDIAVSAAGSTLYELCACGVPTVTFAWADNQLEAVSAFGEGYMIGCGDYRGDQEGCLGKIAEGIARLTENMSLRSKMSRNCTALVTPQSPRPL